MVHLHKIPYVDSKQLAYNKMKAIGLRNCVYYNTFIRQVNQENTKEHQSCCICWEIRGNGKKIWEYFMERLTDWRTMW